MFERILIIYLKVAADGFYVVLKYFSSINGMN